MQVYGLITCVRRTNENAGNLISGVQFLINVYIVKGFAVLTNYCSSYSCVLFEIYPQVSKFMTLHIYVYIYGESLQVVSNEGEKSLCARTRT